MDDLFKGLGCSGDVGSSRRWDLVNKEGLAEARRDEHLKYTASELCSTSGRSPTLKIPIQAISRVEDDPRTFALLVDVDLTKRLAVAIC